MTEDTFLLATEPHLFQDHSSALPSDVLGFYNHIIYASHIPYTVQNETEHRFIERAVEVLRFTIRAVKQNAYRELGALAADPVRMHHLYCDIRVEADRIEEEEEKARARARAGTKQVMLDRAVDHRYELKPKYKLDKVMNLIAHDDVIVNIYQPIVFCMISEFRAMGEIHYYAPVVWPEVLTDQAINNIRVQLRS